MVPRKLYGTNKHGARIRLEHTRICDICPYGSNSVCKFCQFNAVNILGIRAAFSPKESYRRAHKDDISASPLMQKLDKPVSLDYGMPNNSVLPKVNLPHFPVKSAQSLLNSSCLLRQARRQL
jgi:hypothetical protein